MYGDCKVPLNLMDDEEEAAAAAAAAGGDTYCIAFYCGFS
jgi:hypothetical protein